MKIKLNEKQAGLSLGGLFVIMHTLWSAAVASGIGGWLLDLAYSMHFVTSTASIASFNLVSGVIGIALAFACGYVTGYVFALIWNWSGKKV